SKPDHIGGPCFESGWDRFACTTLACSAHAHHSQKLNLKYVFVMISPIIPDRIEVLPISASRITAIVRSPFGVLLKQRLKQISLHNGDNERGKQLPDPHVADFCLQGELPDHGLIKRQIG
ncbi:MAG: hypothetical protein WAM50_20495, partial [Pseudolabrys sp.]